MCTGCMSHADFLATSGILGVASLRVGARMVLGPRRRGDDTVTDAEADAFVASLRPAGEASVGASATPAEVEPCVEERSSARDGELSRLG